jgi:predicted  nucleic acid-binding Zn-ribbon protein
VSYLPVAQRRSREKAQTPPDLRKLVQQAEKYQEEVVALQKAVETLLDKHSLHLEALRKMSGAT